MITYYQRYSHIANASDLAMQSRTQRGTNAGAEHWQATSTPDHVQREKTLTRKLKENTRTREDEIEVQDKGTRGGREEVPRKTEPLVKQDGKTRRKLNKTGNTQPTWGAETIMRSECTFCMSRSAAAHQVQQSITCVLSDDSGVHARVLVAAGIAWPSSHHYLDLFATCISVS